MKILLKILLLPITFILSIIVHASCFLVSAIGGLLNVLSFLILLGALALFGFAIYESGGTYWQPAIVLTVVAFVISPYGLPKVAALLVGKIDELNELIKSI